MQVFISYSNRDKAVAEDIVQRLSATGIEAWSDLKLVAGDNWMSRISNALESSSAIVILVSPDSVGSSYVRKEWSKALEQSKRVLPILIGGLSFADLPPELAVYQALSYDSDPETTIMRIVEALRNIDSSQEPPVAETLDIADLTEKIFKQVEDRIEQKLQSLDSSSQRGQTASAEHASIQNQDNTSIFVVTAFRDDMEPIYDAIKSAAETVGLRAERVKDRQGDYRITDAILDMIKNAYIVVADLTHERPNVYFELGYARALGKTVVTIVRQGTEVHFDVYDWTHHTYFDSRPLEKKLVERFQYELNADGRSASS